MRIISFLKIPLFATMISQTINPCSIFYYINKKTNKIYFVNNEDYWYDVKPYLQIIPKSKKEFGRIWYGWDDFGQGGVNEAGLVIDGAVTPEQDIPAGYSGPKGNITDDILARFSKVDEVIDYLEYKKIALKNAHIFLGDKNGTAKVVEWVKGVRNIVEIQNDRLVATNFNLSDINSNPADDWRYTVINKGLDNLESKGQKEKIDFLAVANVIGKAVQIPQSDSSGKIGGTLYSTFIDLNEMNLVLIHKLNNSKMKKLNILKEVQAGNPKKISLE